MVAKSLFNVLHVGTTTREDDATEQFVDKFVGYLVPHVFNNLIHTSLDDFHKFTALHMAFLVNRVAKCVIDVVAVSICTAIFQFDGFCFMFLHLNGGNIFCDVVSTKRDDGEMS